VSLPLTPSQTAGPFFGIGLPWPDGPYVVPEGTPGAITIGGTVRDGAGQPVTDAMVETWQADPDGRFAHPDDPRGSPAAAGFRGFGRCLTDGAGHYQIVTLRPGRLPAVKGESAAGIVKGEPGGGRGTGGAGDFEAPHLDVSVFARGLLDRLVTRIYFPDEQAANEADPVLAAIADPERRATLIAVARAGPPDGFRFDIRLQGKGEPGDSKHSDSKHSDSKHGAGETVFFDV
jgi:protocatechuate 3,4-dioxygenase, alpha subunit